MMIDDAFDTDGTAFICPECNFNGKSLPELISHLDEAHSEETINKSESPPKNLSSISNEKRSRRKPAFSHQIISQAPRQTSPIFKQSNVDPGSIHFWNRVISVDENDRRFSEPNVIRDENIIFSKTSPQRPIAPKITNSPSTIINSPPVLPQSSFYSSTIQPIQKNFQCRVCHLTYKNFHDCTAHIRRKHEISHAQAGRYVGKLDTDVPYPPSATGHYKIRLKVKSLPPPPPLPLPSVLPITTVENFTKTYQCKYCSYSTPWLKDIARHEKQKHKNYTSYTQDELMHNNNNNNLHDLSALLIDNVESYNDILPNQSDDMIMIEEDVDDDEDDALWRYQQEINNLSESTINSNNNNNNNSNNNNALITKSFKKFQCPHCEHSSPKLAKLKLHIATHTNIKPFMCSICGWRANLRWYIQCHAKKRHPNQNFEVLQLSQEEAEQTINAYMREHGFQAKLHNRHDSKHHYQCSLCQFRSNHPRFIEQHIEANHTNIMEQNNNSNMIPMDTNAPYSSKIVYSNFSTHPNFNPNRLYYCSLCYRGYRWRYDVKRHHKTMHETPDDELKSRNFHYLEYIPHLDSLISATMSSIHNQLKNENDMEDDDDLKLSIADARTVAVTDDEAIELMMIEPEKSDRDQIVIDDHPEDSIIIFEEDRPDKSSIGITKISSSRPSYKPFRCPYCFYRTNWRTDCIRHIRARHKIEPSQHGYYEMSHDDAEKTYDEYERTYGFVVSKKVLARYTDFRQIEWEDLKKTIWEKIKDKTDFEQSIYDRLQPDNYTTTTATATNTTTTTTTIPSSSSSVSAIPSQPIVVTLPNRNPTIKPRRVFTCMDCAFHSHRIYELERHVCSKIQKFQSQKSHGQFPVSLYECTKCLYRTMNVNYAKQHTYLHQLKDKKKVFYYCSFCGYNHRYRNKIIVHIAKNHPKRTSFNSLISCHYEFDADFSIRHAILKRSFIEQQLKKPKVFYCLSCPYISATIVEHNQHRSYHQKNSLNLYKCQNCSFASNSLIYTNQHKLLHSKQARLLSSNIDIKNLKYIPVSTIYKEILGKSRRYNCPFCNKFPSNYSSTILNHIKNIHAGNSKQFHGSLIIGADMAKEILFLGGKENK
ncbi:unnamed protein product [Adineta steineri]|uniref:C2H2-type domain-containing protein n=1 Tax=Adineta steineri TaxID=433720 RepID=A0A813S4I1_9BILA|nr:unnamed protein product [Adineta steineri]CAF1039842.1 unnamed protein product [Adineta steineri]